MFNTIGRAQGWSDTPLTVEGERGIHEAGLGLNDAGLEFKAAFSSDSGRTIQTMEILLEDLGMPHIPYLRDKRIREWCFGSLDGGYDGELFDGVLPRTDAYKGKDLKDLDYKVIADGLMEVDTAGWAEPWEKIRARIMEGFEDMAHAVAKEGGGNVLIVSHGMTIGSFVHLIQPEKPRVHGIDNGSVTVVDYDDESGFSFVTAGDMSYRYRGQEIMKNEE
jgi:probable phosphoglycerate mutase